LVPFELDIAVLASPCALREHRYNVVAKRMSRRLDQLGATPIVPLGLGDDQVRHSLAVSAQCTAREERRE
jgi:hypothetical protein